MYSSFLNSDRVATRGKLERKLRAGRALILAAGPCFNHIAEFAEVSEHSRGLLQTVGPEPRGIARTVSLLPSSQ
jgi:hypothetical protein